MQTILALRPIQLKNLSLAVYCHDPNNQVGLFQIRLLTLIDERFGYIHIDNYRAYHISWDQFCAKLIRYHPNKAFSIEGSMISFEYKFKWDEPATRQLPITDTVSLQNAISILQTIFDPYHPHPLTIKVLFPTVDAIILGQRALVSSLDDMPGSEKDTAPSPQDGDQVPPNQIILTDVQPSPA